MERLEAELRELRQQRASARRPAQTNLAQFAGSLRLPGDPLDWQRRVRRGVGMTGLLDTSVALYLLGGRLVVPSPVGDYGSSLLTETGLLGWPSLTPAEEVGVRTLLEAITASTLVGPTFASDQFRPPVHVQIGG